MLVGVSDLGHGLRAEVDAGGKGCALFQQGKAEIAVAATQIDAKPALNERLKFVDLDAQDIAVDILPILVILVPVPDLVEKIQMLRFFVLTFGVAEGFVIVLDECTLDQTFELPNGIDNDGVG